MLQPKPSLDRQVPAAERRFAIVLNASAGSVLGADPDERARGLAEALHALVGGGPIETVAAEGDAIGEAVERAASGAAEVVVIAGGDGTVSSAAPIVRKHGKILGVIPLGTYNLLARDLEIPLETEQAIATLAEGAVRDIDVATVNGRMFLCQSGFGFFTRVAYARQKARRKTHLGKWMQSAFAFVDAIRRLRRIDVAVHADGRKLRFRTLAMLVAINSYHRNPEKVLQRDRLDGGRFALYSVRYRTIAGLLLFGVKLLLGIWHRDERLHILSSTRLVLGSRGRRRYRRRRVPLTADGELVIMRTPVRYRLYPRALKVLAPRPTTASGETDAPDRPPL